MQAHEWSNGDISPEITFTADDGRKFGKKFSMNLKVNTAPVLEYAGIGKTTESGEDYYVLIFRVKNMDTPITAGSLHKDLNGGKLIVTAGGGSPEEIPLSFNAGKTDFETGGVQCYHKSADLKTRKIKEGEIWSSTIKNLRNRHCYCRMR